MNAVLSRRRPQIFYGWYIAGAGFLSQMIMGVLIFHSFGTYVALMQDDFGWSRTTFSVAFALQRVESGLLGPIQGWVIDKYGPRSVMLVGLVMLSAGFFFLSTIDSLLTFYLAYVLIAVGASLGSFLSLVVALVNWFRARRARAISLLSLGFAVGGFVATPAALLIEGVGWRAAAFGSGVLVLMVSVPLALLIRHRPEDYGMLPDGASSEAALADDPDAEDEEWGMSVRDVLKTSSFWLIAFGHAAALLVIGAFMVHLVVYIDEDLEFGLGLASFAITIQTIGQVCGQGLGAYAGDRWPKRPLIVAALLGHATAIFLLALSTSSTLWLVYAGAAVNGMAWGLRAPLQTAIRADYFGRKSFGLIMGFSSMVIMIGMITGPTLAGVIYDQTGSYRIGFFVLAIAAVVGAVLFAFARPPAARERWQAEAIARRRQPSPAIAGAALETPREATPAGR